MFIDLTILANFSQICLSEISLTNFHDSSLLHAFLTYLRILILTVLLKAADPSKTTSINFLFSGGAER